ncbi:unannotated protein [freshwater metagenome]|jgi:phosphoribosylanthranilate isomerase|uniref:phosphoribosylanthranilate isomerase n=1 Tax=freshwater metagenome TaxID=449393 RepID=A0A6J7II88_9ZZZZ
MKICGLTGLEDAQRAVGVGAWALGMVFVAESPRRCELPEAELIARTLRRRAEICGVFVNEPLDDLTELADAIGLTMIQLHGDEGPAYCDEVRRRTGAKIIKAVRVHSGADLRLLAPYHVDFHLLDAHHPTLRGGTGETWDWELVAQRRSKVPLILSGGLHPENVEAAIATVYPYAVDVASGTEAEPGRKDPQRLADFAAAVARTGDPEAEEDLEAVIAEVTEGTE